MDKTKFTKVLESLGLRMEIRKFSQMTRTAQEAAKAVGCDVAQIAKSLVFRIRDSETPLLIITSGANRVSEVVIRDLGYEIEKADAEWVKGQTGYVIGGVPPFGFEKPMRTFLDRDLLKYEEVWAAAGENNAVFKIGIEELTKITKAVVIKVK